MAKLNDKQKLLLIGGLSVLLATVGGFGVWWADGLAQEKTEVIAAMHKEMDEAQGRIRQIPKVEQDVIILRENLYEYVKILPEETELNDFVRVANQFKSQSGVNIVQFLPGRTGNAAKGSAFERYEYKFELQATLWQFLHFMSLFEDYERFVAVKEFVLSTGLSRDDRGLAKASQDAVHQITLTVETYVYRGSKSKEVVINSYTNKVDKLRDEIFEARQTIARAGYKFQGPRGRRDIFIDPREASGERANGAPGPSPRDQRRLIDRMRERISELQTGLQRLQDSSITIFDRYSLERELREGLVAVDKEVEEMNSKAYISHAPLKLSWTREVLEPLTELKRATATLAAKQKDKWLPEAEMQNLLARMREDLKTGEIQAAMERYAMLEERLRVPENDHRYPLYTTLEGVFLRAKLAEEFAALPLKISGICVSEAGRSGLVLNGAVFQEGDYIDNNLLVKAVDRERVEFVYKGFTIVKIL